MVLSEPAEYLRMSARPLEIVEVVGARQGLQTNVVAVEH